MSAKIHTVPSDSDWKSIVALFVTITLAAVTLIFYKFELSEALIVAAPLLLITAVTCAIVFRNCAHLTYEISDDQIAVFRQDKLVERILYHEIARSIRYHRGIKILRPHGRLMKSFVLHTGPNTPLVADFLQKKLDTIKSEKQPLHP